jgi:hypothetical protein
MVMKVTAKADPARKTRAATANGSMNLFIGHSSFSSDLSLALSIRLS